MQTDFDVFSALVEASRLGAASLTVHNVQLLDVQPNDGGDHGDTPELMTIEHAGTKRRLLGGRWSAEWSRRDIGKFGYLVPAHRSDGMPVGACYFHSYTDQSLRRVPELDYPATSSDSRAVEVIGWRCDARPSGFRAPVGLIPGEDGRFVPDETVAVTLRVPPEFVRGCRRVQMTPEKLLRSFVGDLAGIQNYINNPRADGYGSNGSDERDYADAWLRRAHAGQAIDLEEQEEREKEAEEEQYLRDDFAGLLDDFAHYGGKRDDLFAAVQKLVDEQQQRGNAAGRQP